MGGIFLMIMNANRRGTDSSQGVIRKVSAMPVLMSSVLVKFISLVWVNPMMTKMIKVMIKVGTVV